MASIFRYPGSKRRLLKTLDTYFRPHLEHARTYHSVLVGSGADLLHVAHNYPHVALYANDLDEGIASLWRVVVGPEDDLEALEERILMTVPTLALRDEIKRQMPEDRVGRSFQVLFLNRTSYSGIMIAGPLGGRDQEKTKIDSRWNPGRLVGELRKARALLRGRLQVASMDATAYLTYMAEEDPEGLYYCDPPYWHPSWQLYREIMTTGDHERLAAVLRTVPQFVLSYDLCPEVEALYSFASIHEVETVYTTAKTRGAKKRARRTEVMVVPKAASRYSGATSPSRPPSSAQEEAPGGVYGRA